MEKNGTMAATAETASLNGHGDFIAKQKTRLEENRLRLLEDREILLDPKNVGSNFENDPGWEAKIRRIGVQLNDIDIAFLRIKNGVYRRCVKCGTEISTALLEKCPAKRICPDCVNPEPPKKMRRF